MKCPRCPDALQPVGTQGQAHKCPRGHGHLLSREEVGLVFEARDASAIRSAPLGSVTPGADCPSCGEAMRRSEVAHPHRCDLDVCASCGAAWFDGDELARLAEGGLHVRRDMVPPLRAYLRRLL